MRQRLGHVHVIATIAVCFALTAALFASVTPAARSRHQATVASWDYVALGDSVPYGSGDVAGHSFVFSYARFVEHDTGASVVVHNLASDGGTSRDLLALLKGDASARRQLKAAEIITISIGGTICKRVSATTPPAPAAGRTTRIAFVAGLRASSGRGPSSWGRCFAYERRGTRSSA